MYKKGFTLLELLTVIVIIGVLATLGFTHYSSSREQVLDREAQANLRLIIAAERIYRMENDTYYASGSNSDLNDRFRLLLDTGEPSWNYITTANGRDACCAQATRNGGDGRAWRMRDTDPDPVSAATCP